MVTIFFVHSAYLICIREQKLYDIQKSVKQEVHVKREMPFGYTQCKVYIE